MRSPATCLATSPPGHIGPAVVIAYLHSGAKPAEHCTSLLCDKVLPAACRRQRLAGESSWLASSSGSVTARLHSMRLLSVERSWRLRRCSAWQVQLAITLRFPLGFGIICMQPIRMLQCLHQLRGPKQCQWCPGAAQAAQLTSSIKTDANTVQGLLTHSRSARHQQLLFKLLLISGPAESDQGHAAAAAAA